MIRRCDLLPQYLAYKDEIDAAIKRVLNSGVYVFGAEVSDFEAEFALYNGVPHAVGVANGTDGLILALQAVGVKPGDQVITTPFTPIPTVAAIVAAGAEPLFVDVCRDTFLIDIEQISDALTPKTKAIVPVHLFGNVVDIPRLRQVVGPSIPIVEDAAQAHGSSFRGRRAGTVGDMGVFSFYPTKNLGAYGDGGAVVTKNAELAEKIRLSRAYGLVERDETASDGVNSRLDELQAAILNVKLKHLDEMNDRRRAIAETYNQGLEHYPFIHQRIEPGVQSNCHLFVTRFQGDRDGLVSHLANNDIQTNIYFPKPLHLQEAYARFQYQAGDFPATEALCKETIALPLYPEFLQVDQEKVLAAIERFCAPKS